ncbi:MAG: hypothetical protein V7L02_31415, partial [Nostoc sp.]|uniref:hypothetical protein n=1 Tax=Nostoc sp. TaxID=1180 RepID=UPI002FF53013
MGITVGELGAIFCSWLSDCPISVACSSKVAGAVVDTSGMGAGLDSSLICEFVTAGSTGAFCTDISVLVLSGLGCVGSVVCICV